MAIRIFLSDEISFVLMIVTVVIAVFSWLLPSDELKKGKKWIIFICLAVLGLLIWNFVDLKYSGKSTPASHPSDDPKTTVTVPDNRTGEGASFSGGTGEEAAPFQISSASQLNNVRLYLSSHFVLISDIDLSDVDWEPIGNNEPFTGVFDGGGHTIKNIRVRISSDRTTNIGLFGEIDGGVVRNLCIENGLFDLSVTSSEHLFANAGGFAGLMGNGSLIECCSFSGNVYAHGYNQAFARGSGICSCVVGNSRVANCYSSANIQIEADAANTMTGGITAWLDYSTIENCYVLGTLSALNKTSVSYMGGIGASGSNGQVSNCVVLLDNMMVNGSNEYSDAISYFASKKGNLALKQLSYSFAASDCKFIDPDDANKESTYLSLGWDFDRIWYMSSNYPNLTVFS